MGNRLQKRTTKLERGLDGEDEEHHLTGSPPQHLQWQTEHSSCQGDWGRRRRELLRLCAGQRAPEDSPSLAKAAAAVGGAGALAQQTETKSGGAAAEQGAQTPKLFIYYPALNVDFPAKL